MKQIDKIKMLTEMLFENVKILEEYPDKVKEWETKRDEYKEKKRVTFCYYSEPYPIQETSQSHIRDIAKILRKELLKL